MNLKVCNVADDLKMDLSDQCHILNISGLSCHRPMLHVYDINSRPRFLSVDHLCENASIMHINTLYCDVNRIMIHVLH